MIVPLAAIAVAALLIGRSEPAPSPPPPGDSHHSAVTTDTVRLSGLPDEVYRFLENGQAWRAAGVLRRHLQRTGDDRPEALLLAARTEAGWGGWSAVREYLAGEEWLDDVGGGEGWFLLGRAQEEAERWEAAMEAFRRFREVSRGPAMEALRPIAQLREGLVLMRLDRDGDAAAILTGVSREVPGIADRIDLLAAEALAPGGDSAAVRRLVEGQTDATLIDRGRRARLAALEAADDPAAARDLAVAFRREAASAAQRAWYAHTAARHAIDMAGMGSIARIEPV